MSLHKVFIVSVSVTRGHPWSDDKNESERQGQLVSGERMLQSWSQPPCPAAILMLPGLAPHARLIAAVHQNSCTEHPAQKSPEGTRLRTGQTDRHRPLDGPEVDWCIMDMIMDMLHRWETGALRRGSVGPASVH